jgi:hypothetical protein
VRTRKKQLILVQKLTEAAFAPASTEQQEQMTELLNQMVQLSTPKKKWWRKS